MGTDEIDKILMKHIKDQQLGAEYKHQLIFDFVINNYIECEGYNEWLFHIYQDYRFFKKIIYPELITQITEKFNFNYENQARNLILTIEKIEHFHYTRIEEKNESKGYYYLGKDGFRSELNSWDNISRAIELILEDNTRALMVERPPFDHSKFKVKRIEYE